jgi:hypothetical protein
MAREVGGQRTEVGWNFACRFSCDLRNFAAINSGLSARFFNLFRFSFHSNWRIACMAAIVSLLIFVAGCAMWDRDRWKLDSYRDAKAVDIEKRLERTEPVVKNPF